METNSLQKIKNWFMSVFATESETKEQKPNGLRIFKDTNGEYRYFAWVTNNFEDRDEEIIPDFAHKEFLSYLDRNPEEAPEFWSWHTLGTARKNRADWWEYANGFFMYSGILTEAEAKAFDNVDIDEIGMSHGFYAIKLGKYIVKYRTFEISDLPRNQAANPFTGMNINKVMEENSMFTSKKREYLTKLWGEDVVAELESQTKTMEEVLEANGIERKELEEKYEEFITEYAEEKTKETVESLYDEIVKNLNINELHEVLQTLAKEVTRIPELVKRLETLEAENKALKESYDSRISNIFTDVQPMSWASVQTGDKETQVEEEDLNEEEKEEMAKSKQDWMRNLSPLKED